METVYGQHFTLEECKVKLFIVAVKSSK